MEISWLYKAVSCCWVLWMAFIFTINANNMNAGGHNAILRSMSAWGLGQGTINLGGSIKGDYGKDYVAGPNAIGQPTLNGEAISYDDPLMGSGNIFLTYGIFDLWDIGLCFPLYVDVASWDTISGRGDLEIATKLTYPFGRRDDFLSHAYYLKLIVPSGSKNRGYFPRHVYHQAAKGADAGNDPFTVGKPALNAMLIWTFRFANLNENVPLLININFGGVATESAKENAAIGNIGVEYSPIRQLSIFTEVSAEARLKWYDRILALDNIRKDYVVVTPGFSINYPHGFYSAAAIDIGIASSADNLRSTWQRNGFSYSTEPSPFIGGQLCIGWKIAAVNVDRDKDGIADKNDKCPYDAEDKDDFEDEDGCPDPDNDNDGVADVKDKCPDQAEECDGCPVLDRDNDGVEDRSDKCIDVAEDKDGFEDADGCPDLDNDKDGIPDDKDRCPDNAEDNDGFEDYNGCPDLDNDGDGVLDVNDNCINDKGPADNNGCPKAPEIKRGNLILKGVTFASGKAVLEPNSYTILDGVYESLREWPEVKIEIGGYTDSQGDDMKNLRLSQARADAVRLYLIKKGIEPSRMTAVGYGEANPIADNNSAEGRALNRRVELRRID